jgi:hypothetical protein
VIVFNKLKEKLASIGEKVIIIGFIAIFFDNFNASLLGGLLTLVFGMLLLLIGVKK